MSRRSRSRALKRRFGLPVMKVIGIREPADLAQAEAYRGVADRLLLDAKPPKGATRPGGNAVAFDWAILDGFDPGMPWMLSGGLDPGNVGEAVRTTRPPGVDVSSGVESAPGRKDLALIAAFIAAARAAETAAAREPAVPWGPRVALDSSFRFVRNRAPMTIQPNTFRAGPDERGFFGIYGGRFVAETLMPLILELEQAYDAAKKDPAFHAELENLNTHYAGRPSPLYFAERLTEHLGGAKIYFKRDELNHTGSHKINNCLGQILLARRMGKTRIIAETGAGQHGVAVATVAARFGLPCVVYMGATDIERQKPNVFRMRLLGAELKPVTAGNGTLKDAMNEALRDWVTNVEFDLLPDRHRRRPAPLSGAGARLPVGDRQGDARADHGNGGPAAGRAGRLHRRRLQRHRPVPSLPRRPARWRSTASRPAATGSTSRTAMRRR